MTRKNGNNNKTVNYIRSRLMALKLFRSYVIYYRTKIIKRSYIPKSPQIQIYLKMGD